MSVEENKAIVRRFTEEFNKGNLDVLDEVFAADCARVGASAEHQGSKAFKRALARFRTAFPDLQMTNEDMVAEGDKVWVRWSGLGTHQGEFGGVAPTGKQVTMLGVRTYRFSGGKVVEHWGLANDLGVMRQLGAVQTQ